MSNESNPILILQQLSMELMSATESKQLIFRILNKTVSLCGYKRAVLLNISRRRAKFMAVSGKSSVDKYSEMVEKWEKLASTVSVEDKPQLLLKNSISPKYIHEWEFLENHTNGLAVYWLPINPWGKTKYAVWFERWDNEKWDERDLQLLNLAGMTYKAAFERLEPPTFFRKLKEKIISSRLLLIVFAVLLTLLLFWRVPLRVVAPCEIIPEDPFIVTAPLSGVVMEVQVESGDNVKIGSPLFEYDSRVVLDELKIARQQLNILETTIKTNKLNALKSDRAKAELAILDYRREQEKIRLSMAEYRASMLQVRAETSGAVIVDNPDEWRGRPVEAGQRVLMVVDPENINLRIWLPEADNVDFGGNMEVKVFLNAFPDKSLEAKLKYVAQSVSTSPEGVPSVMAEGSFEGVHNNHEKLRIGLKGSAILYGEKVSVVYWLLRKPWASVRRILGI
ncbi:efflux RND transporter periplasmic adaptor subunit [Maridesulfovibrio ferrireducens]|uniref:efflux RND transporter periplasmic adaptor subunit n=1 Tax=Maridesulfovibrio ferrireducens TaxID=246191 RepID=UPI001A1F26E4|nr:efflux RND transporter periplasmic adaptor subunit [Maridesulfovibrio ferrireducens]MBI9112371.1 efflux RND transporter periplasmic adaptor subunit [Maridesulfovibrio ferrireducens]